MSTNLRVQAPRPGLARGVRKQLEAAGYLERELVVRGAADLFAYDQQWNTVLRRGAVPYTTRIIVREPSEPARASGDAVIEALHPAGDMASAWVRTGRTILREGMRWIGVTQDVIGLRALKLQDAERYAELDIPEQGLGFDIVAQVASWLRSEGSPWRLSQLFMTGASYTGTFQRVFLGDGFHARARRPDGGPAVDGYLIQISSGAFMLGGYTPLSEGSRPPPAGDRRRTIAPRDVPVIEMLSEGEVETHEAARRPDSDAADDRYRLYEVPGAAHMTAHDAGPLALPVVETPSDFPMDMLVGGALLNLRRWVRDDVPPPRAERMVIMPDRAAGPCGRRPEARPLQRDEHGNAALGLRSPWVDVPIATYYPHSTPRSIHAGNDAGAPVRLEPADVADLMGCMSAFAPDKLRALYGTPERYRERFDAALQRLVDGRWIAPEDAERARRKREGVEF